MCICHLIIKDYLLTYLLIFCTTLYAIISAHVWAVFTGVIGPVGLEYIFCFVFFGCLCVFLLTASYICFMAFYVFLCILSCFFEVWLTVPVQLIALTISADKECDMRIGHHRLNGSSSPVLTATPHSYLKGQNSTPCKIKTPERIRMKFCTVDYVLEISPHNKFGDDRSSGGFWVNMWNIRCLLLSLFFPQPTWRSHPNQFSRGISQTT